MDIFSVKPRPLISSKKKLVVSWSQKSACSHVIVWHFLKEGLLPAVNYYHGWPHKFRTEVYYKTKVYQRELAALQESGGEGYTLLKITRDPAKRLVSMFRHACRYSFMHDEFAKTQKLDLKKNGLSFLDLRTYLATQNLYVPTAIDPHMCAQIQPLWGAKFDRTITLNMDQTSLNSGFNMVEEELGFNPTKFDQVPKFNMLRKGHYSKEGEFDKSAPIEEYRFKANETDAFPKAQLTKSELLQATAREFYSRDYGIVDSGDTAGTLFQS